MTDQHRATPEQWEALKACIDAIVRRVEALEAAPASTPQPKGDEIKQAIEELEEMERKYYELANSMIYRGNSVAHWHAKATAYKDAIGAVWTELQAAGVICDGTKSSAEGVKELASEISKLRAPMTELRAASAEARPAGGLVERVAQAIHDVEFPHGTDEARAAIREIAAWLKEQSEWVGSDMIEQEADRG
jgi:hypothetical protein